GSIEQRGALYVAKTSGHGNDGTKPVLIETLRRGFAQDRKNFSGQIRGRPQNIIDAKRDGIIRPAVKCYTEEMREFFGCGRAIVKAQKALNSGKTAIGRKVETVARRDAHDGRPVFWKVHHGGQQRASGRIFKKA